MKKEEREWGEFGNEEEREKGTRNKKEEEREWGEFGNDESGRESGSDGIDEFGREKERELV